MRFFHLDFLHGHGSDEAGRMSFVTRYENFLLVMLHVFHDGHYLKLSGSNTGALHGTPGHWAIVRLIHDSDGVGFHAAASRSLGTRCAEG